MDAAECDDYEPPSAFFNRLSKDNVWYKLTESLNTTGELNVQYNDWDTSETDKNNTDEDNETDDDGGKDHEDYFIQPFTPLNLDHSTSIATKYSSRNQNRNFCNDNHQNDDDDDDDDDNSDNDDVLTIQPFRSLNLNHSSKKLRNNGVRGNTSNAADTAATDDNDDDKPADTNLKNCDEDIPAALMRKKFLK